MTDLDQTDLTRIKNHYTDYRDKCKDMIWVLYFLMGFLAALLTYNIIIAVTMHLPWLFLSAGINIICIPVNILTIHKAKHNYREWSRLVYEIDAEIQMIAISKATLNNS